MAQKINGNCCPKLKQSPKLKQISRLQEILTNTSSEDDFYQSSKILKALSDPTRLKIIYLLQERELCVCEIMHALEKPQSTVSHHLNILKNACLIKWRKDGIWIHYQLSNQEIWGYIQELTKKIPD